MAYARKQALRLLSEADRQYRTKVVKGKVVDPDERGVEIWARGTIHIVTALSLVDAQLAEMVDTRINTQKWLFLGRCDPYDDL